MIVKGASAHVTNDRFAPFSGLDEPPYNVKVGRRVRRDHPGGMRLVAHSIGDDVIVRQNTTFGIAGVGRTACATIGNGGDIGAGAVIVGQIVMGAGARIRANGVAVRDVAPGTTVGGVPARMLSSADKRAVAHDV